MKPRYDISRESEGVKDSLRQIDNAINDLMVDIVKMVEDVCLKILKEYYCGGCYFLRRNETIHLFVGDKGYLQAESCYYDVPGMEHFEPRSLTIDEMYDLLYDLSEGNCYSNERYKRNHVRKYAKLRVNHV